MLILELFTQIALLTFGTTAGADVETRDASPSANVLGDSAEAFQGYWMGTDPLNGSDHRRDFVTSDPTTVSMVGRDSFILICGTDQGAATFEDGVASGQNLATDNFLIKCFNTGTEILLKARYELLETNVMIETLTTQEGYFVMSSTFYRVSG
ncbi:hypothetical protein ENSA7_60210 [Enhygromyxa salina]|uniref:Lipocalin-like domain-containing protein n=2 Tax=Enhygromyxa salina TaxID=215803 RepID=A0A2S9Y5Z5_9BACT|nr:hypothetical protein ENSA7_60210 [Enhygromyxa salina]